MQSQILPKMIRRYTLRSTCAPCRSVQPVAQPNAIIAHRPLQQLTPIISYPTMKVIACIQCASE